MKSGLLPLLIVPLAGLPAGTALSQDLQRGQTVLERARPETEPLGVRSGPITVLPQVETGMTYDDNIFATQSGKTGDFIWTVQPQIRANWDLGRHSLNLMAGASLGRHLEHSSENYDDYRLEADGRIEATSADTLDFRFHHRRDHEGRGDPNTESSLAEPVVYYRSGGELTYEHTFGRIRGQVFARFDHYDFDNTPRLDGTTAREDDRNRWETAAGLRVGYEMTPGREVFVRLTHLRVLYDQTPDASGRNRDSWGYEAVAGASYDITGLITAEVFAGYLARSYTDATLKDFGGPGFGARLNWSVTPLTTVTARITRSVEETTTERSGVLASNYTRTLAALRVDHELLRSLILNARLQWRNEDYGGIDRTDNIVTAGAGATYTLSRNIYLSGDYTFEKLFSNGDVQKYSSNIVFLRLGFRL